MLSVHLNEGGNLLHMFENNTDKINTFLKNHFVRKVVETNLLWVHVF